MVARILDVDALDVECSLHIGTPNSGAGDANFDATMQVATLPPAQAGFWQQCRLDINDLTV